MAGGALGGVFGAGLRVFMPGFSEDLVRTPFYSDEMISQSLSAVMFMGLCLYVWWQSTRSERRPAGFVRS
jgi:hypothetical protein